MFTTLLAALFGLAIGLAFCFAGYRLFLVMLPIWGFFAAFWLGAEATALLLGGGFLATTTGWVIGFILGLIGAMLSYLFYLGGVALLAAAFGAALGTGFMAVLGLPSGFLTTVVAVILAVVMVVLTIGLNLQKYAIIVMTGIGGANIIVVSVLVAFGQVSLESLRLTGGSIQPVLQASWFWAVIWLLLAVAGIVGQVRANRTYQFDRTQYIQGWG